VRIEGPSPKGRIMRKSSRKTEKAKKRKFRKSEIKLPAVRGMGSGVGIVFEGTGLEGRAGKRKEGREGPSARTKKSKTY